MGGEGTKNKKMEKVEKLEKPVKEMDVEKWKKDLEAFVTDTEGKCPIKGLCIPTGDLEVYLGLFKSMADVCPQECLLTYVEKGLGMEGWTSVTLNKQLDPMLEATKAKVRRVVEEEDDPVEEGEPVEEGKPVRVSNGGWGQVTENMISARWEEFGFIFLL